MSTGNMPRPRRGRPPRGGSPGAAAADRQRRREEYVDLRPRLAIPSTELAKLLGVSVGTLMRWELVRRTRERLEEHRLWRKIKRELLAKECQEHLAHCGIVDPDNDDMEDAA